ncbi:cytokine receptor family member b2 isoform X2 [Dunckerocampus dactyliophorus]|uniref:cytokine receptor family member b2 isoform X2 n=1 Tax=Dunckerocampus dactyliophorus TaxID=161453 RepID=UPI00240550F3|nr:cytokine receptor family member b2 isoform X2 [Dunckerocampus dactyliophorus]
MGVWTCNTRGCLLPSNDHYRHGNYLGPSGCLSACGVPTGLQHDRSLLRPKSGVHNKSYSQAGSSSLSAKHSPWIPAHQRHVCFCDVAYLDLPLMAVTPCGQNLCVDLHPQMQHLRDFYESLCYQLRIKSSGAERAQETTSLKRVILKNLAPGRGYCISVRFFDSVVPRVSNYSQPQCAFTSSIYTSESLFVVVLCIVVIAGLIIVILLVNTGFLCLRRRPMPPALTSIPHTEEVLVFVPHKASLSPLFIQAPLHSPDEEMDGYKTHQFSNLLCASLPLPASFSEPLPSSSSNLYSMSFREEFYCPKPQVWIWNDASSNAASKHLTASRPSISDCLLKSDHGLLADEERLEPMEEENGGIGEMDNQSVNLNTLILGRLAEEEEEKSLSEQSGVDCFAQQEHENLPVTPSEDSFETIDEDEHFVYMTRPSSSDL